MKRNVISRTHSKMSNSVIIGPEEKSNGGGGNQFLTSTFLLYILM